MADCPGLILREKGEGGRVGRKRKRINKGSKLEERRGKETAHTHTHMHIHTYTHMHMFINYFTQRCLHTYMYLSKDIQI